ncbi:MAG: hypothetical protein L0229_14800 [Blastocatellia bacterium]|nr:hypothetical protein [Blastocatellia bacterium]
MTDIKKQFSLDYLFGPEEKKNQQRDMGSQALEEAIIVYSEPIFKALRNAQDRQMRTHDLIRAVNQQKPVPRFEEFVEVINRLESLKFVEITERDITGNHLVHLLREP